MSRRRPHRYVLKSVIDRAGQCVPVIGGRHEQEVVSLHGQRDASVLAHKDVRYLVGSVLLQ